MLMDSLDNQNLLLLTIQSTWSYAIHAQVFTVPIDQRIPLVFDAKMC